MTHEDKKKLAGRLEGTCDSIGSALEELDLDYEVEEVEEALLDLNIELCRGCGWWMESCELEDDDDEICGYCHDCVPRTPEEGEE